MKTIFLILLILFASCSPSKKAHKYFNSHPKEFAKDCFINYPCVTKDSVVKYVTNDSEYNAAINKLAIDLDESYRVQDSLIQLLSLDTLCNKYLLSIKNLQQENSLLKYKISNLPARIITKEITKRIADSAQLTFLNNYINDVNSELNSTQNKLQVKSSQYDEIKQRIAGKVLIAWWWLLIAGAIVGGFIFLRLKNIISPIKI